MKAKLEEMVNTPKYYMEKPKSTYVAPQVTPSTRSSVKNTSPSLVVPKSSRTKTLGGSKKEDTLSTLMQQKTLKRRKKRGNQRKVQKL